MSDGRNAEETLITKGQVTLSGIDIQFGAGASSIYACKDFAMEVFPGEFVCIVGPSGCGKSSILNVLAGFLKPSQGDVNVDGKTVTNTSGASRGVVFQDYALFPWLTAGENVSYGARMHGKGAKEQKEIARKYLSLVGLNDEMNHFPDELSGGMQQRVGIARVLANSPDVMLMDEPFGALDAQTRLSMQQLLLDIWARSKTTIIFVTHDLDEALLLSDRIFLMGGSKPGRLVEIIDVPFTRPRSVSKLMTQGDYAALKSDLVKKLHL
jgi:NitT/TauT family transport system ATP-binding protein